MEQFSRRARIVTPPFDDELATLLRDTSGVVQIASPWLKRRVIEPLLQIAPPHLRPWSVLTRGLPVDFVRGASDIDSLELLVNGGARVFVHQRVHAKAYVTKPSRILIGSNNLTVAGTRLNLELAIAVDDEDVATEAAAILSDWVDAAKPIDAQWCRRMREVVARVGLSRETTIPCDPDLLGPTTPLADADDIVKVTPDVSLTLDMEESISAREDARSEGLPETPSGSDADSRYTDLPLPEEWREWLPTPRTPGHEDESQPAALLRWFGEALATLDDQEAKVVLRRFGQEETLDTIGRTYEVTRERIRQIEATAIACVRTNAPAPENLFAPATPQTLVAAFSVTPDTVIRTRAAAGLGAAVLSIKVESKIVGDDRLVVAERTYARAMRKRLDEQFADPRYRASSELASDIGIDLHALRTLADIAPKLEIIGELVGWRWSKWDRTVALARLAAQHGVIAWHVSQMAKALAIVDPDRCGRLTGRLVIAIVSRANQTSFATTGRKGEWLLAEHGDGFHTTFDAVVNVLKNYDERHHCPLHVEDLHSKLARDVPIANVQGLLNNNEERFKSFGKNVFGLAGCSYPSDGPVQSWILRQLGREGSMPLSELVQRANRDDIPSELLRGAAQVSDSLKYVPTRFGGKLELSSAHGRYPDKELAGVPSWSS